jgi:hypothetical protein
VANIEKEFKAFWLKISTFSLFPLKSVTNDQEWRLSGWSDEDKKKQYKVSISEKPSIEKKKETK